MPTGYGCQEAKGATEAKEAESFPGSQGGFMMNGQQNYYPMGESSGRLSSPMGGMAWGYMPERQPMPMGMSDKKEGGQGPQKQPVYMMPYPGIPSSQMGGMMYPGFMGMPGMNMLPGMQMGMMPGMGMGMGMVPGMGMGPSGEGKEAADREGARAGQQPGMPMFMKQGQAPYGMQFGTGKDGQPIMVGFPVRPDSGGMTPAYVQTPAGLKMVYMQGMPGMGMAGMMGAQPASTSGQGYPMAGKQQGSSATASSSPAQSEPQCMPMMFGGMSGMPMMMGSMGMPSTGAGSQPTQAQGQSAQPMGMVFPGMQGMQGMQGMMGMQGMQGMPFFMGGQAKPGYPTFQKPPGPSDDKDKKKK